MNELNFFYFTLDTPTKATGKIYGDIGCEVIGSIFAQEFEYLESHGVTEFDIRILSYGGAVTDSLMIYSALTKSKAQVTTYNDGLAASCAGWLFLAGKKAIMMDYALLMMHNPWSYDNTAKGQEVLEKWKQSIVIITSKRSGNAAKKISDLMDAETWLDAQECLAMGLCTAIENTEVMVQVQDAQNLDRKVLMGIMNSANNKKNNMEDNTKDEVKNTVEPTTTEPTATTAPEATEPTTQPTDETQKTDEPKAPEKTATELALELKAEEMAETIKQLTTQLAEREGALNKYLEAEKKAAADAQTLKVKNLVEGAITVGKITEEKRDKWMNLANQNFELAQEYINEMEALSFKKAKPVLNQGQVITPVANEVPDYHKLRGTNRNEFNRIFKDEPTLFNEMFKNAFGVDYKVD